VFEHVLSPDGKNVWCEDYNAPDELKSRWIPIDEWNKIFENKIRCPLCSSGFLEIKKYEYEGDEYEDLEDPCSECDEWFTLESRDPLTLIHNKGVRWKHWFPIDITVKNLKIKGEIEIETEGDEEYYGFDEYDMHPLDTFIHNLPNEIIEVINKDETPNPHWERYSEVIEELRPIYIFKDGSYSVQYEEE